MLCITAYILLRPYVAEVTKDHEKQSYLKFHDLWSPLLYMYTMHYSIYIQDAKNVPRELQLRKR
jgi:hypothetical protein